MKIQKKNWGGGGSGGRGSSWGGQGGCDRRIEVFGKIHKKKNNFGRVGFGGIRVDVNEELKFLETFTKKQFRGGGSGLGGSGWI